MSVGARERPFNWDKLSRGEAAYTGDLIPADACYVAVVRSPYPHAEVGDIDTSAAAGAPGTVATLTSADFPTGRVYQHRGGRLSDWPPLATDRVRYVGQEVAAVAAETAEQARAAAALIRVRYRRLPAPLSMTEALAPGAPTLHARDTGEPNVSVRWTADWGDVARGRELTTRRVSGRFRYPATVHACMEPNIVMARWHDDRQLMELWVSTQAPYFITKEVAHILGLAQEQVFCREVAVGGGFGSKSKIQTHEAIAAALARKSGRIVVLRYDRDEEFTANKTRHEFATNLDVGFDDSGILRLFEADIRANNGAHNHMGPSVLKVGAITLGSLYRPEGVHFDARLVDTAQLPGGPFRGYGTPQVTLALESLVDEVAHTLAVDPIDLRLANLRPGGEPALCGYRVGSSGLDLCLKQARHAAGWDEHRAHRPPGVGKGVAVGMHGSGSFAYEHANRSDAAVDIDVDGDVTLRFGGADAGTGQRTILAQIVAGELGLSVADVRVVSMDGERTPFDMGAWSSRGTQMSGHAVRLAAQQARDALLAAAVEHLGNTDVTLRDGSAVAGTGSAKFAELVATDPAAANGVLTFEASFVDDSIEMMAPGKDTANLSPSYAFAAHIASVRVDPRIGRVELLDYVAAHDLGRPINPTLAEGQIIGGVAMGIGAALGEELLRDHGKVVNGAYINYALPRAGDLPAIRPIVVDVLEEAGPYGAKSVGEMSLIPAAPAIANAVKDAIGVRITDLPITPDKVVTAVSARAGRRRRPAIWRRPSRWWITALRWLYPRGLHRVLAAVTARVRPLLPAPYRLGEVSQPTDVGQALRDLARGKRPLGGGTDVALRARQGIGGPAPLVATGSIAALRAIDKDTEQWLIGAAVTLDELAAAARDQLPGLAKCLDEIATVQVRNVATVAGNLVQEKRCWFYRNGFACYKRSGTTAPCYAINGDHRFYHAAAEAHRCQATTPSDLATALYALDADVRIVSGKRERWVPIETLYTGPGETLLTQGDLITHVRFAAPVPGQVLDYEKLNLYDGDFALVSAAIAMRPGASGAPSWSRCVLGGIAPTPMRLHNVEAALQAGRNHPEQLRLAADGELTRRGHPLPGNGWKLDAAAGIVHLLAERVSPRLTTERTPASSTQPTGRED